MCISVTSRALDPLPCHKLSHLLGPPPPSSVTYFMDGHIVLMTIKAVGLIILVRIKCINSITSLHALYRLCALISAYCFRFS